MATFLIGVAITGKVITGFSILNQPRVNRGLVEWYWCLRVLVFPMEFFPKHLKGSNMMVILNF